MYHCFGRYQEDRDTAALGTRRGLGSCTRRRRRFYHTLRVRRFEKMRDAVNSQLDSNENPCNWLP